ncbi:rhombosortase [Rhodoferax sp. AJA081-3]|uniref:rhombosortase n=1 Tax=Rhodoferax sp. AJA081-3 TaxID=2752316 RepID=UPI001AE04474|nr:rhombosortase [Rhodoferax sp. AJA081-3]QTN29774.1 rhombosortase [Rhodoferax sp. AJA081-3]
MAVRHSLWSGAGLWSLGFVVVTLGLQWLPGAAENLQFVRPTYVAGAWWQLFTAQWVHMGTLHAAANALGLVVLLRVFQGLISGHLQVVALLGGYAGVAVVLALDPHCTVYAGASGALHGLLAGSACALLASPPQLPMTRQRMHILACCVLLGLAAKLLVQHFGTSPTQAGWLGFATYYPAHEAGAVGGLLAVVCAAWLLPLAARGLRRGSPADPGTGG